MSLKTRSHHRSHVAPPGPNREKTRSAQGENAAPQALFPQIQLRAYQLWEQAGRPGDDDARQRFWLEAENEICRA
jgi:hypothetical protein